MGKIYWADDIYQKLTDDESRKIFENRILYSCTGSTDFIDPIACDFEERKEILEIQNRQKKYLFGAGTYGYEIQRFFPIGWDGVVDNDSRLSGTRCGNLTVFQPQILDDSCTVVIANRYHNDEIERQLLDMGIPKKNIINTGRKIDERGNRQYFDVEYLQNNGHEVFVDAGALNGNTAILFAKWAKRYQHIYCMEPDQNSARNTEEHLGTILERGSFTVIPKAVGNVNKTAKFSAMQDGNSSVSDEQREVAAFIKLDGYLGGKESVEAEVQIARIDDEIDDEVSFIKMDVEGAELDALRGAENTIKKYRPKLAISVYHKANDIIDIPKFILGCHEDYRLILRHYSMFNHETVLYAV